MQSGQGWNGVINQESGDAVASLSWFGVRTVSYLPWAEAYEERITLWRAKDLDHALEQAIQEAAEHCRLVGAVGTDLAQAYGPIDGPIGQASEVFSLIRRSAMSAENYLTRHFDTGEEHQQV
jgi:hypothetical protein